MNQFITPEIARKHLDNAIISGDLKSVQHEEKLGRQQLPSRMEFACSIGHLNIVKYIGSKYPDYYHLWSSCAMGAAKGNRLKVFKHAESKGISDEYLIQAGGYAAEKGHINILKHIVSKGHINWKYYNNLAELEGQEEILQYCRKNEGSSS